MKIGILQCDSINQEFKKDFGDYPEMFIKIFKRINNTLEFAIYDVRLSEFPKHLEECGAYLITGSRYSVYDDEDWIRKLESYVIELNQKKIPLIGICFGHQIIAKALGGKTELADNGWGVGVHTYKRTISNSLFNPLTENFSLVVSHQDQVTKLPENAELIAESEFCPLAAFRVENHILTFQGHPEFSKEYSKTLMGLRKQIIGKDVFENGLKSLEKPIQSEILIKWILNFLKNPRFL